MLNFKTKQCECINGFDLVQDLIETKNFDTNLYKFQNVSNCTAECPN